MTAVEKLKTFYRSHHRSVIIGGIVFSILICAGGYALWSNHSWTQYQLTYTEKKENLKKAVKATLELPVKTSDDRLKKLADFKEIAAENSNWNSLCEPHSLIGWQSGVFNVGKQQKADCELLTIKVATLRESLINVTTYLEIEHSLAKSFKETVAVQPATIEADWEAVAGKWHSMAESIQKMPNNFQLKSQALLVTQGVENGWNELLAAHKAKDKSKYLQASKNLTTVYSNFGALSSKSAEYVAALSDKAQKAYIALP